MGGFVFFGLLWIEQQRIECCFYHEGLLEFARVFGLLISYHVLCWLWGRC
jgi:hypothetical protein